MSKFLFCIDHKWLVAGAVMMSLLGPSDGYAQTRTDITGEVINVNRQLQVAFVDIGERDISRGDVVGVQVSYEKTVYMQVMEVTGIISKIGFGPVVERNFGSEKQDFQKIKIGNPVVKIDFYDPEGAMMEPAAQSAYDNDIAGELLKQTQGAIEASEDDAGPYAATGNEECPKDQAACGQRVKDLEKKLNILTKKLRYMKELIEKGAFSTTQ